MQFEMLCAVVIVGLASARVWKLLANDVILDRPREALFNRTGTTTHTLIECPWCLGTHISLALWTVWMIWEPTHPWIAALAVAYVVGLIGEK